MAGASNRSRTQPARERAASKRSPKKGGQSAKPLRSIEKVAQLLKKLACGILRDASRAPKAAASPPATRTASDKTQKRSSAPSNQSATRAIKSEKPKDAAAAPDAVAGPKDRPARLVTDEHGSAEFIASIRDRSLRAQAEVIVRTLGDLSVPGEIVALEVGPRLVRFGVQPGYISRGGRSGTPARRQRVRVAKYAAVQNDLAVALGVRSVRVECPVPGKSWVGIEVPHPSPAAVKLSATLQSETFKKARERSPLVVPVGQDMGGSLAILDIARAPHVLIAGATGAGKSVCVNAMLTTLIAHTAPAEVRLLLVDPKRVEMAGYADAPHLLGPVVVEAPKAISALIQLCAVMDARYTALAEARVKNILGYNRRAKEPIPYIVCVIDELADLMLAAGDHVESQLCRLAQLGRACGIHVVVATQRPSVDVITGLIKANVPTRIAFAVASQVDSRTILDTVGAEKLLGRGDMLYAPGDEIRPTRLQGVFADDAYIERCIREARQRHGKPRFDPLFADLPDWTPPGKGDDPLLEEARKLAEAHGSISASFLQRKLRIGHTRAVRLLEALNGEDDDWDSDD